MRRYGVSASKAGLPPGTLVHVGHIRSERAKIVVLHYTGSEVVEKDVTLEQLRGIATQESGITWIHVAGLAHVEAVERVGQEFGIHPLALEDIVNTNQRPKLEDYGEYLYMTLKTLHYQSGPSDIVSEHINLILGKNFVLSFQESQQPWFHSIRERIMSNPERFGRQGAGYLAYALLDTVVDGYFVVLENLGERVEELEERLIESPDSALLAHIHDLKREMLFLRRSVWPLREVVAGIERGSSPLFADHTMIYIRDVYDHTVQVIETLETYRDMASSMIDIYLSGVSNRMNEVVKMLTVISTIFMPLTFLAGVYGMNFKFMPELEWEYGYPAVLCVMAGIGHFMYRYFRNKHWI